MLGKTLSNKILINYDILCVNVIKIICYGGDNWNWLRRKIMFVYFESTLVGYPYEHDMRKTTSLTVLNVVLLS